MDKNSLRKTYLASGFKQDFIQVLFEKFKGYLIKKNFDKDTEKKA